MSGIAVKDSESVLCIHGEPIGYVNAGGVLNIKTSGKPGFCECGAEKKDTDFMAWLTAHPKDQFPDEGFTAHAVRVRRQ